MIVSKKQKYKSLKNSNLNNKSVLILDSFISCMNKKSHNINIPTNINTLGYRCFYDCENIKSLYVLYVFVSYILHSLFYFAYLSL